MPFAEMVSRFLEGQSVERELETLLDDASGQLQRQHAYLAALSDSDAAAGFSRELEEALASVAEAHELLGLLDEGLQSGSPEMLQRAEEFGLAATRAWEAVNALDEARAVAGGPTPLSSVNRLLYALETADEAALVFDTVGAALRSEIRMVKIALVAARPDPRLQDALQRLLAGLEAIERTMYTEDAEVSALQKAVEQVQEAAFAVHEARLQKGVADVARAGPTPIAALNLALYLVERQATGEEVVAALQPFFQSLPSLLASCEAVAETVEEGRLKEQAVTLHDALVDLEVSVAGFEQAVTGQGGGLEEAADELIEAARSLAESEQALRLLADLEGRVPCVKCGHYNAGDRAACEKCNAVLPKAARENEANIDLVAGQRGVSAAGQPQVQMTENLLRIFNAADRFAEGRLAPEGFLGEVDWLESHLRRSRSVLKLKEGEAHQGVIRDYLRGLDAFEQAVSLLREAGQSGAGELLEAGRRKLWDATGMLQQARASAVEADIPTVSTFESGGRV